jgi:hypothetical protein
MPRTTGALAAAAALCALPLAPFAPLAAQAPASPSRPGPAAGAFTLTPHVGFTTYSDLAEFSVRDDGTDPSLGSFEISGKVKLQGQFTAGVTGAYQPATSRWGAFGDYSRSSGDARLAARYCFDDPDLGRYCDRGFAEASGSQWRLAAGVTHRSILSTATATLSLGALYGKTHLEMEDPDTGEKTDASESNPGIVLGAGLEFPLARRIGLRMELSDAVMRVSNDTFGDATGDATGGLSVESDPKIANALSFGVGVVLKF